jgi:hypothetical protein
MSAGLLIKYIQARIDDKALVALKRGDQKRFEKLSSVNEGINRFMIGVFIVFGVMILLILLSKAF